MVSQYLITPPALWDDPPVDDFDGEQLPVGGGDEPWVAVGKRRTISEILSASPECEGPEKCWYNSETGYTEFCEKHNGMLLDADLEDREGIEP